MNQIMNFAHEIELPQNPAQSTYIQNRLALDGSMRLSARKFNSVNNF